MLTGGAGIDTISGLGEVDRILAQDRDRDNIDCGSGAPDEALVSLIGEGSIIGCEKVLPVRTATNNGGLVGTPRLMPAALRLSAGEPARLRLSWRHPRGWRQLRKIELRLYDRDQKAGQIVIRPRGKRIAAHGAVELMRKSSRVAREGKTVSARLALRLDRSLGARRLRDEVSAVDIRGRRQVERKAGSIRMT